MYYKDIFEFEATGVKTAEAKEYKFRMKCFKTLKDLAAYKTIES